jgi:hypothetical protein
MSSRSVRVVEAPLRLAVTESILRRPDPWAEFLRRSYLWDEVRDRTWSAEHRLNGHHVGFDTPTQLGGLLIN